MAFDIRNLIRERTIQEGLNKSEEQDEEEEEEEEDEKEEEDEDIDVDNDQEVTSVKLIQMKRFLYDVKVACTK